MGFTVVNPSYDLPAFSRDALLRKLISDKIRVKDAERLAAEAAA